IPDDRSGARRSFHVESVGVGLVHLVHVKARAQVVLVDRSLAESADEALPHARVALGRHGIGVGVPAVEVAHHGEAFGVGSPHREVGALMAVDLGEVRAQLVIQAVVLALVKQVEIEAGKQDRALVFALHFILHFGRRRLNGLSLWLGRKLLFGVRWSHGRVLLVAGVTRQTQPQASASAKRYKSNTAGAGSEGNWYLATG